MLGCATDCHLDGQGRILVQQQLREHASLAEAGCGFGTGGIDSKYGMAQRGTNNISNG